MSVGGCWHCGRRDHRVGSDHPWCVACAVWAGQLRSSLDEGHIGELVAVGSLACDLDGAPVRSMFNGMELWSNRFHLRIFEQAAPQPSAGVPAELIGPLVCPHDGVPIEWNARTDVHSLHVGTPTGGGGSEVLHQGEVVFVPELPAQASKVWFESSRPDVSPIVGAAALSSRRTVVRKDALNRPRRTEVDSACTQCGAGSLRSNAVCSRCRDLIRVITDPQVRSDAWPGEGTPLATSFAHVLDGGLTFTDLYTHPRFFDVSYVHTGRWTATAHHPLRGRWSAVDDQGNEYDGWVGTSSGMDVWRGTIQFVPPLEAAAESLTLQPEQLRVDPPVAFALDLPH